MAQHEAVTEDGGEGSAEKYVVKNFALTEEQSEWLRRRAYEERRTQAEIVREAIDRQRKRTERADERANRGS